MRQRPDPCSAHPWRGTRRMATTDARSGFRLPWSSDRQTDTSEEPATESKADVATTATETVTSEQPAERRAAVDPWTGVTVAPEVAPPGVVPPDASPDDAAPSAAGQAL